MGTLVCLIVGTLHFAWGAGLVLMFSHASIIYELQAHVGILVFPIVLTYTWASSISINGRPSHVFHY